MQSGIKASSELHSAFNAFTADPSSFALPITIASESLTPLEAVPYSSNNDFTSSLSSLSSHLQPKTPIFLILRKSKSASAMGSLVAITYIPSTSPVRSKTLFASTRATLVRELGLEKFSETLFVTDAEEVLDPAQWKDRDNQNSKNAADAGLLSTEERELQSVKRAEEEERHGTQRRNLMGGGASASEVTGSGVASNRLRMKITDDARQALSNLGNGDLVQLGIDLATETINLQGSQSSTSPDQVSGLIPSDRPSYIFYQVPSSDKTLFLYTCPGASKIKERMVYASSRISVLEAAKSEGIVVAKRLEAGDPDELQEPRLSEEAGIFGEAGETPSARQGFAKPKRPGRR